MIVGYTQSRGFGDFEGLGWMVRAYIPVEEAYAPIYQQVMWFATVSLIAIVIIFVISLILANKMVSGLIHQEILAQELDVAHNMQMGLLSEDPNIAGLDVAGKCITANHVGGDYYNYLWLDEAHTRLAIVIADVAGHDMTAAIPTVMFSGMLEYAGREESPGAMLHMLSKALCRRPKHTSFITCCIGAIDLVHKMLVWSKAGHPEIYHYRRQKDVVVEFSNG